MSVSPTLQNLLWEKNPTGIQDFMYPLTEAELVQLWHGMEEAAMAAAEAEWEDREPDEVDCRRHHCQCCEY